MDGTLAGTLCLDWKATYNIAWVEQMMIIGVSERFWLILLADEHTYKIPAVISKTTHSKSLAEVFQMC